MQKEAVGASKRSFWRWAITPPQSYLIYLVCLVLIFVGSFYAGTLKPKKPTGLRPPPVAAPSVARSWNFHSSWHRGRRDPPRSDASRRRSAQHTSGLQSRQYLAC